MMTSIETCDTISVPQTDGSDTRFFLRSLVDNPMAKVSGPQTGEPTCFNGKVAIRLSGFSNNTLQDAPANHHHIAAAEALLLKCWPEIHQQFGEIVKEFYPKYLPDNTSDGFWGSMSHQPPNVFGSMWATVNDYICSSLIGLSNNSLLLFKNKGAELENCCPMANNLLCAIS